MDRLRTKKEWSEFLVSENILQRFSKTRSHVTYDGGQIHSDVALNINRLLAKPALLEDLCRDIIDSLPAGMAESVKLLATHVPYGRPIAEVFAELLRVPVYVFDPDTTEWNPSPPPRGQHHCLVVADEILTGSRMTRLLKNLRRLTVSVTPVVAVLADFASLEVALDHTVISCVREPIQLWSRSDCPLCAQGSVPCRRIHL